MELGERVDPEQQSLLTQAHARALRLHELLESHQADLLRHAESAEKSAIRNNSAEPRPPLTQPDANVLREGADVIRRTADAAARLIEGLTRALQDDQRC